MEKKKNGRSENKGRVKIRVVGMGLSDIMYRGGGA
jgi:hypothetical protein